MQLNHTKLISINCARFSIQDTPNKTISVQWLEVYREKIPEIILLAATKALIFQQRIHETFTIQWNDLSATNGCSR